MSPGLDDRHLRRALDLAARGRGRTRPNPMVGAVAIRDERVVGEGWHRRAGAAHAEVLALEAAGGQARGATLYVNLEPCAHQGRTGPCVERIIAAGVARVVAPITDPNPEVDGRGFARLREAGIRVETGLLEEEARRLNEAYLLWRRLGRSFVVLKLAATLDGRIATRTGASRWITGGSAREEAHRLRAESDAVLVGVTTVLADDPRLTPRGPAATSAAPPPMRVVIDSRLRTPPGARMLEGEAAGPVLIYGALDADPARRAELEARGATVVPVPRGESGLDLGAVLRDLATREALTVLVEGGGRTAGSLLGAGLVDKLVWFTSPVIFGDQRAVPAVAGLAPSEPSGGIRWSIETSRRVGEDLMIVAYPASIEGR